MKLRSNSTARRIKTKLGGYEIRSKIGEGGMGEVYLAEDTKLHRRVALTHPAAQITRDIGQVQFFNRTLTVGEIDL